VVLPSNITFRVVAVSSFIWFCSQFHFTGLPFRASRIHVACPRTYTRMPICLYAFRQMLILSWANSSSSMFCSYIAVGATSSFSRFHDHVNLLNVSATDLYSALLADAEKQSPNWDLQGRQVNAWKKYSESWILSSSLTYLLSNLTFIDYIPQDLYEAGGASSKQVSRTLEVWPTTWAYRQCH